MHEFLKGLLEFFGDIIRDVCTDWALESFKKSRKKLS
jgi:hypothetical protein